MPMLRTLLALGAAFVLAQGSLAVPKKSAAPAGGVPREFRGGGVDSRITTAAWGPKRTSPVFTGAFQVDLVVIAFPDGTQPDPQAVRRDLDRLAGGSYTIKDCYDDYPQGVTYPVLAAYPAAYVAPKPFDFKPERLMLKVTDAVLFYYRP